MEQKDFDALLTQVSNTSQFNYSLNRVRPLLKLIETREIRDFDLSCNANSVTIDGMRSSCRCTSCLHTAIHALCKCTCFVPTASIELVEIFNAIFGISDVPEFNNVLLLSKFDKEFYQKFVKSHFLMSPEVISTSITSSDSETCVSIGKEADAKTGTNSPEKLTFASVTGKNSSGGAVAKSLLYARRFLHYMYKHTVDSDSDSDLSMAQNQHNEKSNRHAVSTRSFIRETIYSCMLEGLKIVTAIKPAFGAGSTGTARSNNKSNTEGISIGRSQCIRIASLLEVVSSIVEGWAPSGSVIASDSWNNGDGDEVQRMRQSMHALLRHVLLPLHTPNEMEEWRDQTPLIQSYHEPLVVCISKLVDAERRLMTGLATTAVVAEGGGRIVSHKRDYSQVQGAKDVSTAAPTAVSARSVSVSVSPDMDTVLVSTVKGLLKQWPTGYTANTPKEVLLLHELDTLVCLSSSEEFASLLSPLLVRMASALGHDNTRPIQRTLQFFKNPTFLSLCTPHLESVYSSLLPVLYRDGELFWNPTVNKLTGLALQKLKDLNPQLFETVADKVIRNQQLSSAAASMTVSSQQVSASEAFVPSSSSTSSSLMLPPGPRPAMSKAAPRVLGGIGIPMGKSGGIPKPGRGGGNGFNPATVMPGTGNPATVMPGASANESVGIGIARSMLPPKMASGLTGKLLPASTAAGTILPLRNQGQVSSGLMPAEITGVVPWAKVPAATQLNASNMPRGSTGLMPAEITGVAPWAQCPSTIVATAPGPPSHRGPGGPGSRSASSYTAPVAIDSTTTASGSSMLTDFMARCLPNNSSSNGSDAADAPNQWNEIQAALTPTLLPSLRFHDLVFGRELGKGAFSTVKYSRQILREKSSTLWPEFAVKVVPLAVSQASNLAVVSGYDDKEHKSDAKARAAEGAGVTITSSSFDYTKSISREIAILHILCHPSISRLISCFRYSSSAYLVLEYASRGDLHSYILASRDSLSAGSGSRCGVNGLSLLHTRFILGEIITALHYIHSEGFLFCDLKPENVLITALGHLKLTDFGACRPYTRTAYRNLRQSAKMLTQLRDGDWRAVYSTADTDAKPDAKSDAKSICCGSKPVENAWNEESLSMIIEDEEAIIKDHHVEGTLSYLPPEILITLATDIDTGTNKEGNEPYRGQQQLKSATPEGPLFEPLTDSWSLGCVAYFCLVGRPLLFGDTADDILYQQSKLGLYCCSSREVKPGTSSMKSGSRENEGLRFGSYSDGGSSNTLFSPEIRRGIDSVAGCAFISDLLAPIRADRLTIQAASTHHFITTGRDDPAATTGESTMAIGAAYESQYDSDNDTDKATTSSQLSAAGDAKNVSSEDTVNMDAFTLHFQNPPLVDLPVRVADPVSS